MKQDLHSAAEQHFQRGNSFDENGYSERAIAEWEEAVHLEPEHVGALYNLGIALADLGDAERAVEALRQVLRLDPFDLDARRELAQIYLESDRPDDAVNQLRQILNIDPDDGAAAHDLAGLYLDRGMLDETAGALEAGALMEEDADLWFRLGQAYEHQQRREEAVLSCRRALIAQSDHRDADFALRRLHEAADEAQDPDENE